MTPVYHCFTYFDVVRFLHRLSPSKEDRESLEQVEGLLKPLQVELERLLLVTAGSSGMAVPKRKPSESGCPGGALIRTGLLGGPRSSRQAALCKLQELQRNIDGWEGKEAGPACNEFICEGLIGKVGAGKRLTERYAFLFDGLLLLCKPCGHGRRSSAASPSGEYRLKEKFFIRKVKEKKITFFPSLCLLLTLR